MDIEEVREFCLSVKGAEECFPFDDTVLVFKVMDKMFAFMALDRKERGFMINLKSDPEYAIELREHHECVIPGYHSNKKYWNSVYIEEVKKDTDLKGWILHSVDEVIKKLPKKKQTEYNDLRNE